MKTKTFFNGRSIDIYLKRLIKKGFERQDTGEAIIFNRSLEGFRRTLTLAKNQFEFKEVEERKDLASQFEVL
jgi:hypothetical protein